LGLAAGAAIQMTNLDDTPNGTNLSLNAGSVQVDDSGFWQITFGGITTTAAASIQLRVDNVAVGVQAEIPMATNAALFSQTVLVTLSTATPHTISINTVAADTFNGAGAGPTGYITLVKLAPN
jgi:hypothetical protein